MIIALFKFFHDIVAILNIFWFLLNHTVICGTLTKSFEIKSRISSATRSVVTVVIVIFVKTLYSNKFQLLENNRLYLIS